MLNDWLPSKEDRASARRAMIIIIKGAGILALVLAMIVIIAVHTIVLLMVSCILILIALFIWFWAAFAPLAKEDNNVK